MLLCLLQFEDHFPPTSVVMLQFLASGSGLPGIVLAIIMKHKNSEMKFKLYEKSFHKSNFLKEVTSKFDLNVEVLQKNIFEEKNLKSDIVVARAFKPLPVILHLIHNNFKYFEEVILFLGRRSKEILEEARKELFLHAL